MPLLADRTALAPGQRVAYHSSDWDDSLVLVAAGELALVRTSGRRERFAPGAPW
jgi:quercetin dioxygenase-like cupin family protein